MASSWDQTASGNGRPAAPRQKSSFASSTRRRTRQQHDTDAKLKCQWVENLALIVETLVGSEEAAPWPFMAVFWIRLHGVLVDLRSEELGRFQSTGIDPMTYVPAPRSLHIRWSKKASAVVDRHRVHAAEKEFTVAESDAAVRRVLAAHRNEAAIAVAMAGKIAPAVSTLGAPT